MGRVDVGKIYEATKFAADEAGDPNKNIRQVSNSRCMELLLIKLLIGRSKPVIPSELTK